MACNQQSTCNQQEQSCKCKQQEKCHKQQDVYYYQDNQGRACVDLYAKALDILNGKNPDCWRYEAVPKQGNQIVHHAKLLRDTSLEVMGQHSPVQNLTPMTQYNVYFDVRLMHDAKGFKRPIMFEFCDQNGCLNRIPMQLMPGDTKVFVGQFISTSGSQNVIAKVYDFSCQEKSGLLVRCVSIAPADD